MPAGATKARYVLAPPSPVSGIGTRRDTKGKGKKEGNGDDGPAEKEKKTEDDDQEGKT